MDVNGTMNYTEAKAYCQKQEGYILEIYSESECDYILDIMNFMEIDNEIGIWLGASKNEQSDQFKWESAERAIDTERWQKPFPSISRPGSHLALLRKNKTHLAKVGPHENLVLFCKTVINKDEPGTQNNK